MFDQTTSVSPVKQGDNLYVTKCLVVVICSNNTLVLFNSGFVQLTCWVFCVLQGRE